MSNQMITIKCKDADVLTALDLLRERLTDMSPVMQKIAGVMHDSTEQAFADERDPTTGMPWPELSAATLQINPRRAGGQLLRDSAQLVDSLQQDFDALAAYYGTDKPYAAMHQFGGVTASNSMIPNHEISARPYLGLDEVSKADVLDLLAGYLMDF